MTMRPPNQIPNRQPVAFKLGNKAYLWTGKRYSLKTVVASHEWNSALTLQDGIGEMQVSSHEVISVEQFKIEQREEARERYKEIIHHWEAGLRKSKVIAPLLNGETIYPVSVRACGHMIAAAKRWKLIESDKEPDDRESSDENSGDGSTRP